MSVAAEVPGPAARGTSTGRLGCTPRIPRRRGPPRSGAGPRRRSTGSRRARRARSRQRLLGGPGRPGGEALAVLALRLEVAAARARRSRAVRPKSPSDHGPCGRSRPPGRARRPGAPGSPRPARPSSFRTSWPLRPMSATWIRAQAFGQPLMLMVIGSSKSGRRRSSSSIREAPRAFVSTIASLQNSMPVQAIVPRRNGRRLDGQVERLQAVDERVDLVLARRRARSSSARRWCAGGPSRAPRRGRRSW